MPPKRDKTTGLPLPNPVVPETSICLTILVPNALEYRTALKGALSELGKSWNWQQTVGEDNANARAAAELWRERLAQATYDIDCGGSEMSCIDIADCIETSDTVKGALDTYITNNTNVQQSVYNTSVIGTPLTPTQREVSVVPNVGCDLNSVFGSVTAIVNQLDTNNRDFLEVIQLSDNAQQRISKVVAAVPIVGDLLPTEILDFVSQMTVEIKENYEAQVTTALLDEYRCGLFCLARAKPSCELSFQDIVEYFNNRIGTALEPVNFFQSLVTYFIAGSWPGTTVVDIMTLIQVAAWQQASSWVGISLRTLQTVGLLGSNDDDSDWTILCDTCNDDVNCTDFTQGLGDWDNPVDRPYTVGVGFRRTNFNTRRIVISKSLVSDPRKINRVVLRFNEAMNGRIDIRSYAGSIFKTEYGNKSYWVIDGFSFQGGINVDVIRSDSDAGPFPLSLALEYVCYFFEDDDALLMSVSGGGPLPQIAVNGCGCM